MIARARQRGEHAFGALTCQEALADIEPVDGEVIEDDVVEIVEARGQDPLVVPVDSQVNASTRPATGSAGGVMERLNFCAGLISR